MKPDKLEPGDVVLIRARVGHGGRTVAVAPGLEVGVDLVEVECSIPRGLHAAAPVLLYCWSLEERAELVEFFAGEERFVAREVRGSGDVH